MDALIRKLTALGGNVQNAFNRAVIRTTSKARADAQMNVPHNSMSQATSDGAASLASTIVERYNNRAGVVTGHVETSSPHALYVEFGTGPVGAANHAGVAPTVPVVYSRGPWKHVNKKTGKEYYTKGWVYRDVSGKYHSTMGQPARPYLYPAALMNRVTFQKETETALKEAIMKTGAMR